MDNYIFTSWFSGDNGFAQHDHTERCVANDFSLIEKFYKSIEINNIKCIIFHNELSKKFTDKYKTNNISFVQKKIQYRKSYNDERFFVYLDELKSKEKNIEKVIFTDCFDVMIHKTPFNLITDKVDICVGEDPNNKKTNLWISNKITSCNLKPIKLIKAYNAGIIGGKVSTMINFLEMFTDTMSKCPSNINSNMGALNYILNTQKFRLLSGFPLHNRFKSFKHEDAYIQHK